MSKDAIFWAEYQDIWQELYQEFAYAFKNYEEYSLVIKNYLNKTLTENYESNIEIADLLKGAKKFLRNIIHHNLCDNKIFIILNYITSNIDSNKDGEIEKLINWFKQFSYTPSPNVIIDLIDQSSILKETLANLVTNNLDIIKKYGLNKVFDNDLLVLFIEIYCTLNNIDLDAEIDINKNDAPKDEKEHMVDFMPTGVEAFISEIRQKHLEVLTKEQEYDLLIKIKNGDQEAYRYFYEHNCRLVISIARKYNNPKVEYEDLIQEGCIGLMTAIERFDVERGLKFSTYATWWIRQAVLRALYRYGRKTGVSFNKNYDLIQFRKDVEKFADELGKMPSDKEVASHLAMSLEEVQENNQLLLNDCSINQTVNMESSEEIGDLISDDNVKIEGDFITHNLASEMQELFVKAGLTEQEIVILNNRWGLKDYEEKTLSDIGKMFGFTRERARQHEANAIKKLRKYAGTKDFALYLDNPDEALERIKKLSIWHKNHPSSYIVYDIDVSDIKEDAKEKKANLSWDTKKRKNINCLYKFLKQYKKEDIDAVVETLSDEEKQILAICNDYFNNPSLYSTWNSEAVKKKYSNVLSKLYYRLNNRDKKLKITTIYDLAFCKKNTKEEINLAIYMLESCDQEIIKLRYGNDLENPIVSDEWNFQKYGDVFYEGCVKHND